MTWLKYDHRTRVLTVAFGEKPTGRGWVQFKRACR